MLKINTVKKIYLMLGLAVLSSILHNAFFGIFGTEEAIFFILTFVFLLAFVISLIYNIFSYIKRGEPKDLWKLGWIGLLGLVGLIPGFKDGFFGLFGFFAFFIAKKRK